VFPELQGRAAAAPGQAALMPLAPSVDPGLRTQSFVGGLLFGWRPALRGHFRVSAPPGVTTTPHARRSGSHTPGSPTRLALEGAALSDRKLDADAKRPSSSNRTWRGPRNACRAQSPSVRDKPPYDRWCLGWSPAGLATMTPHAHSLALAEWVTAGATAAVALIALVTATAAAIIANRHRRIAPMDAYLKLEELLGERGVRTGPPKGG
jgi:hypothetical protein